MAEQGEGDVENQVDFLEEESECHTCGARPGEECTQTVDEFLWSIASDDYLDALEAEQDALTNDLSDQSSGEASR